MGRIRYNLPFLRHMVGADLETERASTPASGRAGDTRNERRRVACVNSVA